MRRRSGGLDSDSMDKFIDVFIYSS